MSCSAGTKKDVKTIDISTIRCEIKGIGNTEVQIRKYEFLSPDFFLPVTINTIFSENDRFELDIPVQGGLCIDIYIESLKKQSRLVFLGANEDNNCRKHG